MPQLAERVHVNQQRSRGSRLATRRATELPAGRTMARPHAGIRDRVAAPVSQEITVKSKELDRVPFQISAHVPAALPAATPAWTTNGDIHVGPAGLVMPPREQERMLRHEAFHRLHQRNAPVTGSTAGVREAEQLAGHAEGGGDVRIPLPLPAAPALLGFPAMHAPWDRVFVGDTHIIGEVTEAGMTARVLLSYKEIGIVSDPAPDGYHCGPHPRSATDKSAAADLRKAAKLAAALNQKIPAGSLTRITRVLVYHDANNGFRMSGNEGVLVVKKEDRPWEQVVAHEGSHAIFAFHLAETMTDAKQDELAQGTPDEVAIEVGKIFLEMKNTAPVPIPEKHFDDKLLPPLRSTGAMTRPAGIVMFMDTLWSGTAGGHPWDTVDEFFASALGAFQQRSLFDKIVAHYGRADSRIPGLARRLTSLFEMLGDQTALGRFRSRTVPVSPFLAKLFPFMRFFEKLGQDWDKASAAELARVKGTPKVKPSTDYGTDLLVNPDKLVEPSPITCPSPKKPSSAKKP